MFLAVVTYSTVAECEGLAVNVVTSLLGVVDLIHRFAGVLGTAGARTLNSASTHAASKMLH